MLRVAKSSYSCFSWITVWYLDCAAKSIEAAGSRDSENVFAPGFSSLADGSGASFTSFGFLAAGFFFLRLNEAPGCSSFYSDFFSSAPAVPTSMAMSLSETAFLSSVGASFFFRSAGFAF